MKPIVTFGTPRDLSENGLDGVMIRFPFNIRRIHEGAEMDQMSNHFFDVMISGSLQTMWGLGERLNTTINPSLIKILFEYARREVLSRANSCDLVGPIKVNLHTSNAEKTNPFDPNKIPDPNGFSMEAIPEK